MRDFDKEGNDESGFFWPDKEGNDEETSRRGGFSTRQGEHATRRHVAGKGNKLVVHVREGNLER
jgi:hypothetical protein